MRRLLPLLAAALVVALLAPAATASGEPTVTHEVGVSPVDGTEIVAASSAATCSATARP